MARAGPTPRAHALCAAGALLLALAALAPLAADAATHFPLNDGWSLASQNGSVSYGDLQIPVYPHQVLQSKGVIGDPLYRYNELETRWISDETWTYEKSFDVTADQAEIPNADLLFKGLDTFATVYLNGGAILRADNFHRTWRVPVQGLLKPGKNTLRVVLEPALATTLRLKRDLPYTVSTLQQPGSLDVFNYIRKGAYAFGWDWGAAFPINGIHGEVDLVFFHHPHLVGAHIVSQQLVDPSAAEEKDAKAMSGKNNALSKPTDANSNTTTAAPYFNVEVEAQFETAAQAGYSGDLFVDLDLGDGRHVTATKQVDVPATPASRDRSALVGALQFDGKGERRDDALAASQFFATVELRVPRSDVELWWPNGLGAQPLYNLTVSFRPSDGSADCGAAAAAGKPGADKAALLGTPFYRRAPPSGPLPPAHGDPQMRRAARRAAPYSVGEACSAVRRRMGFRTIEVVTLPGPQAAQGDLKASWDWLPPKGQQAVQKDKLTAEAKLLAATEAAAHAKPDWTLYEGKWVFLDTPQVKDPKAPIEGFNFSAPPSNALRPMVPAGNGKMRQAVVTDGDSESFYFRVNGVPVYSKGSNLIPFTLFPTTDNYDQVERTLAAARDAHHNTVRIWGGGIYQSEALHDVADEMGLMVWEEAMFACGSYPSALPGFLSNVRMEIREQVRRLAGRAAVAIWGGNNEVEMSLDWFPNTRDNRMLYAVEYHELFIRTIGGAMRELAPYLHYLDSSASNGYAWHPPPGERNSTVLPVKRWGRPGDWRYGDTHFYNYGFDCESARDFPRAKFVSEFGFLSVPNFETWSEATDPAKGDWEFGNFSPTQFGVNNTMTNYRSRRYSHINEILNQAKRHFRVPAAWRAEAPADASEEQKAAAERETTRLYKQFFWLTNQQQAACYRVGTAAWRRQRSEANALTMGVLYWQLNDVWAGWSWSGYDWAGRWKPMHYALKKEFAPLVAQAFYDKVSDRVEVFAVSDEPVSAKDGKLTVTVRRLLPGVDEKEGASCASRPSAVAKVFEVSNVQIPAAGASRVWDMAADDILAQASGCTRRTCYVTAELSASYPALGSGAGGDAEAAERPRTLSSTGEAFFGYWKDLEAMPRAEIVASDFRQGDDDRTIVFRVADKAGASAALVTLDTPFPGSFDDNGFTLHAASGGGKDASSCVSAAGREVTFRSDVPLAPEDLRDGLAITSLFDYQPAPGVKLAAAAAETAAAAGGRQAAPAAPDGPNTEFEWEFGEQRVY